jgi:hypothetical protein
MNWASGARFSLAVAIFLLNISSICFINVVLQKSHFLTSYLYKIREIDNWAADGEFIINFGHIKGSDKV